MTIHELYFLLWGVLVGWIFKLPFIRKWYRELKMTRDYQRAMDKLHMLEINNRIKQLELEKEAVQKN